MLQSCDFWLVAPPKQDIVQFTLSAALLAYTSHMLQRRNVPISTGQQAAQSTQANQEMIPALLEYVQVHDREIASLRVIALLFLLGGDVVVRNLVHVLYDNPDHHEQLAHAFLFLGEEARKALADILNDTDAPAGLRAEAVSMLGLLGPEREVYEYAQSLSTYGLTTNRTSVLNAD